MEAVEQQNQVNLFGDCFSFFLCLRSLDLFIHSLFFWACIILFVPTNMWTWVRWLEILFFRLCTCFGYDCEGDPSYSKGLNSFASYILNSHDHLWYLLLFFNYYYLTFIVILRMAIPTFTNSNWQSAGLPWTVAKGQDTFTPISSVVRSFAMPSIGYHFSLFFP